MRSALTKPLPRSSVFVALSVVLGLACSRATRANSEAPSASRALDTDENGVQRLLPNAARGAAFRLGNRDPNRTEGLAIERRTRATSGRDSMPDYWTIAAHTLDYSSGGSGKTA